MENVTMEKIRELEEQLFEAEMAGAVITVAWLRDEINRILQEVDYEQMDEKNGRNRGA